MALITTAGAVDADSYAALADTDTYFTNRGITTWTGTDAVKENALRRATTYLDNQYRNRWKGYRTNQTQSLSWPRIGKGGDSRFRYANRDTFFVYGIIDADGFEIGTDVVPVQVATACMEVALLILTGVTVEPRLTPEDYAKSIGKSVGPLRKDIVYADGGPSVDRYMVVEGLLRGLVISTPGASSGVVRLVRA